MRAMSYSGLSFKQNLQLINNSVRGISTFLAGRVSDNISRDLINFTPDSSFAPISDETWKYFLRRFWLAGSRGGDAQVMHVI